MADGSVVIGVKMNTSQADKDLAKLKKEIEATESTISEQEAKKSPLTAQAEKLSHEMRQARAEVEQYKQAWISGVVGADTQQARTQERLSRIEGEYEEIVGQVDKIDKKLLFAYTDLDRMKEDAGGLQQRLNQAAKNTKKMEEATKKANKHMGLFATRLRGILLSAFVFNILSAGFRELTEWTAKVIKSNDEARASIARLKGVLLTLAQPLVEVVIPAFTAFVDVLTVMATKAANLVSTLFGVSLEGASESAKALYEEQQALEGVRDAAKDANKSLAGFDEINKLSSGSSSGSSGATGVVMPEFSGVGETGWRDEALGDVAGKVAAALMIGGIALVAIGAGLGNLGLVIAGLTMLNAGVTVGEEGGGFQSWADTLGLENVAGYVAMALLLGGIVLVAIGAATGSIVTVLAGLGMLGSGFAYAESSGEVQSWVETLGLESVNAFISGALLLGGIAIIAIGAMMGNILMVLAGLGMIGTAVAYSNEETKASWADTLGLESVFDYVTAAMQLAGIALIAIGAMKGNIAMVIAGGVILALGVAADIIGEETLKGWWEVLKLTTIQQWVGAALLLVGIALIAIGACLGNIVMILAGAGMLAVGTITSASEGNLKDWVTTLGLEEVAGWVTAALLLVGIALVVFGILTGNIMMILAGAGMLGAGIAIGVTSGTFAGWLDTIVDAFERFKERIVEIFNQLWGGMKNVINTIIGGVEWMVNTVIKGINGVINALNRLSFDMPDWLGGGTFGFNIEPLALKQFPRLATGAVVPPNREFMAVLGDNKTETEVVSPLSTMKQAMIEALRESGNSGGPTTIVLELDGNQFARAVYRHGMNESRRVGVSLVNMG